jgi:hypothetical protein
VCTIVVVQIVCVVLAVQKVFLPINEKCCCTNSVVVAVVLVEQKKC